MPYTTITELPTNVRNVLPVTAQRMYMKTFNNAQKFYKDDNIARRVAWEQVKTKYKKNKTTGKWVKMNDYSYFIPFADLGSGYKLFFPLGKIFHRGREINFTKEDAAEMVKNFKNQIPDFKIPINLLHRDELGIQGYIKDLKVTDRGVEWLPEFREEKKEEILSKGFRYASPEVHLTPWQAPDGKKYRNVAMGVAITPRPRLGRATALYSEETGEWEMAEPTLEPSDVIYDLEQIQSSMRILQRFERNVKGMKPDARTAIEALKRIARKLIDAFDDVEDSPVEDDDIEEFDQNYKTDKGMRFTKKAYLIRPDEKLPSSWKIRVEATPGNITVRQLGAAAAALRSFGSSKTYRGKSLKGVTAEQVAAAKKRLISLYRKMKVKKEDIPEYLFMEDEMDEFNEESVARNVVEQLLEKLKISKKEEPQTPSEPPADFSEQLEALRTEMAEKLSEKDQAIEDANKAKDAAELKAQEFSEQLAEEERVRRLAEFTDIAKGLNVPVKAEEFAQTLMLFHDADNSEEKAHYNQMVAIIQALGNAEKMAELFKEAGTDAVGSPATANFETLVANRMKETEEDIAKATEWVARNHPEAYKAYDEATVKNVAESASSGQGVEEV